MTLLIDSSHDNSVNHILVLMIQTIENEAPKTHFWRAIAMEARSRGEDYVKSILKAITDDDLLQPMKDRFEKSINSRIIFLIISVYCIWI